MRNSLASRDPDELILEGIVTTSNDDGSANISPMGPVVDRTMKSLRLRPFKSSTTYQNLKRTGRGVFHVTDNVEHLALSTVGRSTELPVRKTDDQGYLLAGVCRWYAFQVHEMDESKDRVEIHCYVTSNEDIRPFIGWNRATHSVLEACILATRVQILPIDHIESELDRLAEIVTKTSSQREQQAFDMIQDYVSSQAGSR